MGHHGKQAAIHKQQQEIEAIRQQAEHDIDNVVLGVKHVQESRRVSIVLMV
jgi:hypothetical protein